MDCWNDERPRQNLCAAPHEALLQDSLLVKVENYMMGAIGFADRGQCRRVSGVGVDALKASSLPPYTSSW